MTPKTYTITIRRTTAWAAAVALLITAGTVVLLGQWAWLVNAGLVALATWLLVQTVRFSGRRGEATTTTRHVHDGPSPDGQTVADAIQQASIRDWMLRDMEGPR